MPVSQNKAASTAHVYISESLYTNSAHPMKNINPAEEQPVTTNPIFTTAIIKILLYSEDTPHYQSLCTLAKLCLRVIVHITFY